MKHLLLCWPILSALDSPNEQSSISGLETLRVKASAGLANTAPMDRCLSNVQSPGQCSGTAPQRASSLPSLIYLNEEPTITDTFRTSEHGRGWDSSTRKRELENEAQITVKRLKRDRENELKDSNDRHQPQTVTDKPSPSPTVHTPFFHSLSLLPSTSGSLRPGLQHINTGCNVVSSHSAPPNEPLYSGAEMFPYRTTSWVPLRNPEWNMYRGMDLSSHADPLMMADRVHAKVGSQQKAVGWSLRNRESFQGFPQPPLKSSLALLQQERAFLREQEHLHMLREKYYLQCGPLYPLHSEVVRSHQASTSLIHAHPRSQPCQLGPLQWP